MQVISNFFLSSSYRVLLSSFYFPVPFEFSFTAGDDEVFFSKSFTKVSGNYKKGSSPLNKKPFSWLFLESQSVSAIINDVVSFDERVVRRKKYLPRIEVDPNPWHWRWRHLQFSNLMTFWWSFTLFSDTVGQTDPMGKVVVWSFNCRETNHFLTFHFCVKLIT